MLSIPNFENPETWNLVRGQGEGVGGEGGGAEMLTDGGEWEGGNRRETESERER